MLLGWSDSQSLRMQMRGGSQRRLLRVQHISRSDHANVNSFLHKHQIVILITHRNILRQLIIKVHFMCSIAPSS